MLLQKCSKLACSLANVYLSAGAWHFIDDVCLLLPEEGVLDLSEERTEGGSGLEHRSDVEVPTHPPDLLTNASYIREVDSLSSSLFPLCSPGGLAAEVERMKERGFHEVVLLFPQVLFLLRNAPGAVVKTPYCTPLHICWIVRPKVQVSVRVCMFTVYSNVYHPPSLLPSYQGSG